VGAGGLFATAGVAVSLASPLAVVILGVAMITAGFFAAHGVASGWAASAGQGRQAASQASAFYLLAYYLGASVFGALGTNLWESGRWPAVAVMVSALLLTATATLLAAPRDDDGTTAARGQSTRTQRSTRTPVITRRQKTLAGSTWSESRGKQQSPSPGSAAASATPSPNRPGQTGTAPSVPSASWTTRNS
jgi:hypothetical protein